MKKYNFKSLMVATFIASATLTYSVDKVSGKTFQPNGGWAVSKVAETKTGSLPYCALARRFDENIVVTMARNTGDEASIAIDFQKDILGLPEYNVSVNPGGGLARSYRVEPVSGKAVVIRMGEDSAFKKALAQSGVLKVNIADRDYDFNFDTIQDGFMQIEDCLASLPAQPSDDAARQAKPTQTASTAKTPSPPKSASARNTPVAISQDRVPSMPAMPVTAVSQSGAGQVNQAVAAQIQNLREDNIRLKNALSRERRMYENQYMTEGETSSKVAELSERLEILERENNVLQDQIRNSGDQVQSATTQAQAIAELKSQNDALKTRLDGVMSDYRLLKGEAREPENTQETSQMAATLQKMRDQLARQTEENLSLKQQVQTIDSLRQQLSLKDAAVAAASQTSRVLPSVESVAMKNLEEKLTSLNAQNRTLQNEVAQLRAQSANVSSNSQQNVVLQTQINDLQAKLAHQSKMNESLQTKMQGMAQKTVALESESRNAGAMSVLKTENDLLKKQVRETNSTVSSLQASLEKAQANTMTPAVSRAASTVRASEVDANLVQRLSQKVKALEEQNQMLQSSNGQAGAANASRRASLSQLRSLEERVRLISRERDSLKLELSKFSAEQGNALINISSENWDLEQATKRLTEAEREVERLSDQLLSMRQSCEVEKTKLEYMLFDPDIAQEEQISKLISLEAELSQMQNQLESETLSYQAEIVAMQSKLDKRASGVQMAQASAPMLPQIAQKTAVRVSSKATSQDETQTASNTPSMPRAVAAPQSISHPVALKPVSRASIQEKRAPQSLQLMPKTTTKLQQTNDTVMALQASNIASLEPATGFSQHNAIQKQTAASVHMASVPAQAAPQRFAVAKPMMTQTQVQNILQQANIIPQGTVKLVPGRTQAVAGFNWDTGALYGTMEVQNIGAGQTFATLSNNYLGKIQTRCDGDYASVETNNRISGSITVSAYEIACIMGEGGGTASVVFYSDGQQFMTIAHEASIDNMDLAMDARDRLFSSLNGQSIAMR